MNKKLIKVVAGVCLAGALCAGSMLASGCGWETNIVQGEYHYTNYGVDYGVKVSVEVQTDSKGDRIRKVTIADSGYTQLSPANPDYGWTDENRQNYLDNEQALLNSYRGLYVADVMAMEVVTNAVGEPTGVDKSVVIAGATQSSGRLLLAVQDALKQFGYSVCSGEYSYLNPYNPASARYGIAVKVVMKGETIAKVLVEDSPYTSVSQGWDGASVWNGGLEGLLASYAGRTRSDILSESVAVDENGVPQSVSDSSLLITGATQGSGRLLLAVQNALGTQTVQGETYAGEYHYTNYGVEYGVKVNVTVNGGVITNVAIADSEYTQLSPANPDHGWTDENRQNYLDNEAALLAAYKDKSVAEVLAVGVSVNENGEPAGVPDSSLLISGATQSSGRLLLAVQNALLKIDGYSVREGEYSYSNYGTQYGVKVKVVLNGDVIAGVAIVPGEYTQISSANPDYGWTDENIQNYLNNEAALLAAYVGKSVGAVITMSVSVNEKGEPTGVPDSSLLISGATQSSGRILLAVQDALAGIEDYQIVTGEYHYTNYGVEYGVKVNVAVSDGIVRGVGIAPSGYTQLSPANPDYGWTDEMRAVYLKGEAALLASYAGKSVEDILAMTVSVNEKGEPTGVPDSSLLISGATQSSGRLLLAVQNALGNLA